jgi:transforming growth factor-beta-induced protein
MHSQYINGDCAELLRDVMNYRYISITLPLIMIFVSCEIVDTYVDELHDIEHQNERTVPESSDSKDKSLFDITKNSHDFSILSEAVQYAGLQDSLDGETPYTLLAPTDEAFLQLFDQMDISAEEFLTEEYRDLVKQTLLYHIIPGYNLSKDLLNVPEIKSLTEEVLQIKEVDGQILVGHNEHTFAMIVDADVIAENGVLHIVDIVLKPSGDNGEIEDDNEEEGANNENEENKNPAEDGKDSEEDEESGAGQDPDNGESDPDDGSETDGDDESSGESEPEELTLSGLLASTDQFSLFREAIQLTGIEHDLSGGSQNTLLVPTNQAFFNYLDYSQMTLNELLSEQYTDFLEDLLLYHVIPGNRDSGHIRNKRRIRTANQSFVNVIQDGERLFVGNNRNGFGEIIEIDIQATNGVIHVIDAILEP